MRIAIGALVLLLLAAGVSSQLDDPLSQDAQQAAVAVSARLQSDSGAFEYRLGMVAAADDDAAAVGRQRLRAFREAWAKQQAAVAAGAPALPPFARLPFADYPEERRIALPQDGDDRGLFCRFDHPGCWQAVLASDHRWAPVTLDQLVLADRYGRFLEMTDYATTAIDALLEDPFSYRHLLAGNRLVALHALERARLGDPADGARLLLHELRLLRGNLLVHADNMLLKMLAVRLIAENLEALALIAVRAPDAVAAAAGAGVAPLGPAGRDLAAALRTETAAAVRLHRRMDRSPELLSDGGRLPGWVARALFKPNMTTNLIAAGHAAAARRAQLSAADFALLTQQAPAPATRRSVLQAVRNSVGSRLAQIGDDPAHWDGFILRLHDLDAKIALLNWLLHGRGDTVGNPYFPGQPVSDREAAALCLDGPHEDQAGVRCLHIPR